jgi:hypothetical protein
MRADFVAELKQRSYEQKRSKGVSVLSTCTHIGEDKHSKWECSVKMSIE